MNKPKRKPESAESKANSRAYQRRLFELEAVEFVKKLARDWNDHESHVLVARHAANLCAKFKVKP